MCGISGYIIGNKKINHTSIKSTLNLMKRRGPDNQGFFQNIEYKKKITLLHSRLSIIDLNHRSNQPFTIGQYTLIFNGIIYNYIELRKKLKKKNYVFKTNSDSEVLLQSYIEYGEKCVEHFEGMWAFAIWDNKKKKLFISRDFFGEKPLYYHLSKEGFFFGSEIKFIKSLSGLNFKINEDQVNKNLFNGYKSLFKTNQTFYKEIFTLENATSITIDLDLKINKNFFWKPLLKIDNKINNNEATKQLKILLKKSLEIRMRSDVPVAFCLSGGVDSALLASLAKKKLNKKISTFSIIDSDQRYNEKDNIMHIIKDLKCDNELIYLDYKKENFFSRIKKLTKYHDGPIATLSYYIHSFLSERISNANFKVAIAGTGADEIFTGYYDHFALHLAATQKHSSFKKDLNDWKQFILPVIRNPSLKNPLIYIDDENNRDVVFEKNFNIKEYSKNKYPNKFNEKNYCGELLRKRMLNELFNEVVPVILKHDDLNSMYHSIENRSPYLDREILNFALTLPPKMLINMGYQKKILRDASKGILADKIRLDRYKKGFNASIASVLDIKNKKIINKIFNKKNPINEFVNLDKLKKDINFESIPNHYSKLIFSIITTNIFLEENNY
jgi:asparagine synthase (glutamine-hydrolysing)